MEYNNYYNRFNPAQNYDRTLFLAGKGLQSAELNEIQDYALHKLKGIGDAIFNDGNIVKGAGCIIEPNTGKTTLEAGYIYLCGSVREIAQAELVIPVDTTVCIGVLYKENIVSELEEPELRDPAIGTRNYQEPGAIRLKVSITWAYQIIDKEWIDEGEFYPIHNVRNGVLIQNAPPPQLDSVTTALARYDRESNGSYVVNGLEVTYLNKEQNNQIYVISEGKAHVDGYEIELPYSLRVGFKEDPDIQTIQADPYTFQANPKGMMELNLNETPVKDILNVNVTVQKTITMTHGAYTGVNDPIPDTAILEIIQAKQGSTIYTLGTDYQLRLSNVDWSLNGNEPAPGSSYQLTYRCRSKAIPSKPTENSINITGAVDGTLVLIDYTWMMPRYDLITIDKQGVVNRIKGMAHPWRPSIPKAPKGQLALAYVYQEWRLKENPKVVNNAVRAIPMSDIESMRKSISNLYDLIAQERLRNDVNSREPSAKKGVFVDPFLNDAMRDQGVTQTAAIVNQELTLPINATVIDTGKATIPWLLPYALEPILEQLLQTSDMKINPYQAFAPIPAKVTITLNVDRWTEVITNWSSPITQRFSVLSNPLTKQVITGAGFAVTQSSTTQNVLIGTATSQTSELLTSTTRDATFMRQATQTFEVNGFMPGECLNLIFDGINIKPASI